MFEIDPSREDLAEEFRADPFGKHSPELQLLLNRMRKGTARGRYALAVSSDGEYTLVQLSGIRGVAPTRLDEYRFSDPAEAEWVAFGLRWQALTGTRLSPLSRRRRRLGGRRPSGVNAVQHSRS